MSARPVIDLDIDARAFRRALRGLGDDLEDLKAAHQAGADLVLSSAVQYAPVVSGTLRSTLRASGTKTKGVVRAGYARVPYAGPIHFGWPDRGIAPQPFLYDAIDQRRSEVIDVYWDRVTDLARRRGLDVQKRGV